MNRFKLSLDVADALANGVVACVKRNGFSPVVVNVVDGDANVLVQKRMDGDELRRQHNSLFIQ